MKLYSIYKIVMSHRKILILLIFFHLISSLKLNAQSSFVKVADGHFIIAEKQYNYIGANYWYGGLLANSEDGKRRVITELDFLVKQGVNNLRILAGSEGEGTIINMKRVSPALQPKPGIFNENTLLGLDFLLSEWGKRKMKAVIYLSNNWEWSGGFYQYLNWCGMVSDSTLKQKWNWDLICNEVSKFYTCDSCIHLYRQQVKLIVERTNSVTGKKYINDDAIMAWQLANEPRPMRPTAIPAFEKWVASTAAFIKSIDSNHLTTTGSEGEMGSENIQVFEAIHSNKNIDYATIHIWPKNWQWFSDTSVAVSWNKIVSNTQNYISKHEQVVQLLNKPLVIEEFGLPRDHQLYTAVSSTFHRDKFYQLICDALLKSVQQKKMLSGINFWAFSGSGKPSHLFWEDGDDLLGDPVQEEQGLNSVYKSDTSTWKIIHSCYHQIKKY